MTLAIFDLDHTLIDGDSDYLWGEYMVKNQIVDPKTYRQKNLSFYQDYQRGTLDNDQYLRFSLEPLTHHSIPQLYQWRIDFVENWIAPLVKAGVAEILQQHKAQQHKIMIISATNLFITKPIADWLGIATVLSTEPEIIDDRYTGQYVGIPTYKEGKVDALEEWLQTTNLSFDGAYFYSDSINDLPLLEVVDRPVAVDPDDQLSTIARSRQWPIITLH